MRLSWRAKTGLVLLVASALISDLQLVRTVARRLATAPTPDDVTRHQIRLSKLRAALPTRGVVGYVADAPERLPPHLPVDFPARTFLWTRYVLSPVIVLNNQKPELVVGNFYTSDSRVPAGLVLVKDFGDGVLLLRHRPGS
jgi:hypothetical protein